MGKHKARRRPILVLLPHYLLRPPEIAATSATKQKITPEANTGAGFHVADRNATKDDVADMEEIVATM